ncbi:MAG: sucrose-specific PTS transporter subunit IIBC [Cetobacterium sp.]|uniref:sucrose-specific PTS transporter subunit IIBC n=1 Tax=Cetobacterium sp. TaxID=2071632 RepID=UPI003F2D3131
MDYKKVADFIIENIGTEKNISSVGHCATRLRVVVKDESDVKLENLKKNTDIKGAFFSSGQLQIILGQGAVNKVCSAILGEAHIEESSLDDIKKDQIRNLNIFQRFARTLSNIFVPIIPAIVASGLLMGVLGMGKTFGWLSGDSSMFELLDMFSNTAFVFLPIILAFSAAKEFGANPYLAAALGGILIHPALQNAWTVGNGVSSYFTLFGMNFAKIGYQGTVLPILIAIWVMSLVEKNLRKIVPNMLDIILTPFLTILITGFISITVIGPLGRVVGDGISFGLQYIYSTLGIFAGAILAGSYSSIVITGMHHSFHAIEANLLANPNIGKNFLLPLWSMANVAQGGAAMAVFLKSKNPTIKSIALPASLSCLLGITEAALFGVNLRLGKPFIGAVIGGAIGGAYISFTKVAMNAVGVTGIPGISIVQPGSMINYIVALLISFIAAAIATIILGFKDEV